MIDLSRSQAVATYLALLAISIAGVFHLPWWSICAGACSLALVALVSHRPIALQQTRAIAEPTLVVSSLLHAALVAPAAYVFGYVARRVWGL